MELQRFLQKYKLSLLRCLLKDRDLRISLFFENTELIVPKFWKKEIGTTNNATQTVTHKKVHKDDIEKYLSEGKEDYYNPFFTKEFINNEVQYTDEQIDFLINIINTKKERSYKNGETKRIAGIDGKYRSDAEKWYWSNLSRNSLIKWTNDRINKFAKYIDFKALSYNTNIEIDVLTLENYKNLWDWNGISGNPSVIKHIEDTILNHQNTVWKSELRLEKTYGGINKNLDTLNDIYFGHNKGWAVKPSVSTNPSIKWDLVKFKKYKSKIDFWLLALFGDLDIEIIKEFGNELDENRVYQICFTKYSDWRDEYPIYRNGWENWLLNKNVRVDLNMLYMLDNHHATFIDHNGDASSGHTPFEYKKTVREIVPAYKIDLSFRELYTNIHLLPDKMISETHIEEGIYQKIIKPAFQSNKNLIHNLISEL